jgi:hypothetical protein
VEVVPTMRTAILLTWPKGAKAPELEFFEKNMRAAQDAFKATIAKKVRAELWESGLGIVRRHNGGGGKINFAAGKTFSEGLEDRRKEAAAEAKAADELRSKRQAERDAAAGVLPAPGKNAEPAKAKGKAKDPTKAKGKAKETAVAGEAPDLSAEEEAESGE